jgi:exopolysaccharide biosynthesis WecB/TagA/CpsF family protein
VISCSSLHHYFLPKVNIAGAFSPPFTGGNEWIRQMFRDFKNSDSYFAWIGLGTPKQDMILTEIAEYFPNAKSIFAVEAVFDFLTKNQKEANQTTIALKIEWLFRLIQNHVDCRNGTRFLEFIFYLLQDS